MAPHPSMLTVEANTSNRARFIGFSTLLEITILHSVVFDIKYFVFEILTWQNGPHDDTQVTGEAHHPQRRTGSRTHRAQR